MSYGSGIPFDSMGDMRFSSRITDSGRTRTGIKYPSPFFDIGHTYLPPNISSLFRWCRYYFYTSPTINAAITKMAAYPVTDLHFDSESEGQRNVWGKMFNETLRIRAWMYAIGLDYNNYGNAFLTISFPFRKSLTCKQCGSVYDVADVDYRWRDFQFEGKCRSCQHNGVMIVTDVPYRSQEELRLVLLNPEDIRLRYREHDGRKEILYTVPVTLRNEIMLGKKNIVETIPQIYIESVQKNLPMVLSKCYHFSRAAISQNGSNRGWGIPMSLPVLKSSYYMQMLRKAQEMIMQEHITPFRILYPQAGSATSDPYSTINLSEWKGNMNKEVQSWKWDQNHIGIMPIPVGQLAVGGDGRALMLAQELRMIEEEIISGMGVPVEFVKGGLGFGGTSLSMHILKNQFETYRADLLEVIQNFLIPEISKFLGWVPIKVRMKRFHMADDLQRASLSFQLNQSGKLSDKTLLEELDYNSEEEIEIIHRESSRQMKNMSDQQEAQAHQQGQAQKIQARYQQALQEEQSGAVDPALAPDELPPESMPPGDTKQPPAQDPREVAKGLARQLSQMPDDQMYENLKLLQPYGELHSLVMIELNEMRGRPNSAAKPLPNQKPPRRGPAQAIV